MKNLIIELELHEQQSIFGGTCWEYINGIWKIVIEKEKEVS